MTAAGRADLVECLGSKFDKLLELMTVQNALIEGQGQTLERQNHELEEHHQTMKKHTLMLEAIEQDATKGTLQL